MFVWQELCYKQSPAFTQKFQKKIFLVLQIHMKNTLFVTTTASPITTTRRVFYPLVNIILHYLESVEELLNKLDSFCFTYQNVDCRYTLFKYRFSGKIFAQSGQVFDNVQRAVDFNHRNEGVDRMPSIAIKSLLRKKLKKHLFSCFQKTKSTQTGGSVFAERIEKSQKN